MTHTASLHAFQHHFRNIIFKKNQVFLFTISPAAFADVLCGPSSIQWGISFADNWYILSLPEAALLDAPSCQNSRMVVSLAFDVPRLSFLANV